MFKPIYKLRDWINPELLDHYDSLHILERIHDLEKNLDRVLWARLSVKADNLAAKELLKKNPKSIDLWNLSNDPAAISILKKNLHKIDWRFLSINPAAIHILKKNLHKIDWRFLSINPAAIHLLEQNLDKIDWRFLSANPAAMHILETNLDKIDWLFLSNNTDAIHLLEKNLDKIDWDMLSHNPAIFALDKDAMRKQINNGFAEELIASAMHPRHFKRNVELYNYDISINEYIN